jgi:heat-inducible transcriptional repressor
MEEITRVVSHYMENCEEALHLLEQLLQGVDGGQDGRVYLGGAGNMLAQPEFRDFARLRPLLSWLEQPESLLDVLRDDNGPALKVRIGVENETSMLRDCSVVTATYSLAGVPIGVIGVIGPTRMEYARVMQLLTRLSEGLSRAYQAYLDD